MVKSIDELDLRTYFRIVCSDPLDLSPLGKGTKAELSKAWHAIVEQDAEASGGGSFSRTKELYEDMDRLSKRAHRIGACIIVLSNKESKESELVLAELGVTSAEGQNLVAVASDRYKGLMIKIDEIEKELGDRQQPTKKECMRQLVVIQSYIPSINLKSALAEYRAAQDIVREMNAKKQQNGQSDN